MTKPKKGQTRRKPQALIRERRQPLPSVLASRPPAHQKMHTSHSVETPPFDEPRLIDYLSVLSRRRRLILGGTLTVVLIGLAAIMLLPRVYQSTATIMVVAAKLDGQGTPMEAQLGTYRAILDSEGIAAQVLAEAGLDKPPHNLQVTDVDARIEQVPGTSVLRLHATAREPGPASVFANGLADLAIKLNQTLSQDEAHQAHERVGELLGQAKERLDKASAELLNFKSTAQVDALRKDVDAVLTEREQLLSLRVEVASEEARLRRSEQELAAQPRVLDVPRGSSQEGNLMAAARAAEQEAATKPQGSAPPLIGLNSSSPFSNPVHEALQYQVSMSRSRLAALKQRDRELGNRKLGAAQLPVMTELYRRTAGLSEREFEWEIAKKGYEELRLRYDQARAQVTSRSSQVQIVGQAVTPTRPHSPRKAPILVGSLVMGLLIFVGLAFLLEYLSAVRSSEARASDDALHP